MPVSNLELVGRLALALVLGMALGLERERRNKIAGLRTHSLVALGAALFTIAGAFAFDSPDLDPTRVAAQVVTGIGFIGAGAILRSGVSVTGLTTAATLWMAAAFGVAAALGLYVISVVAGVFALVVLTALVPLKPVLMHRAALDIDLRYTPGHGTLSPIFAAINDEGGRVRDIVMREEEGVRTVRLTVVGTTGRHLDQVIAEVADRSEVLAISHSGMAPAANGGGEGS